MRCSFPGGPVQAATRFNRQRTLERGGLLSRDWAGAAGHNMFCGQSHVLKEPENENRVFVINPEIAFLELILSTTKVPIPCPVVLLSPENQTNSPLLLWGSRPQMGMPWSTRPSSPGLADTSPAVYLRQMEASKDGLSKRQTVRPKVTQKVWGALRRLFWKGSCHQVLPSPKAEGPPYTTGHATHMCYFYLLKEYNSCPVMGIFWPPYPPIPTGFSQGGVASRSRPFLSISTPIPSPQLVV